MQRQAAYSAELQEIQDEIEHQRRMIKYQAEEVEQKSFLAQKRADLVALKDTQARLQEQKKADAARKSAGKPKPEITAQQSAVPQPANGASSEQPGSAKADWEHLKQFEGAKSEPLDTLMGMIGLEDVKREFLSIKLKVDTTIRQGVSLGSERFSCSLLGNPGTGTIQPPSQKLFPRSLTLA